VSEKRTNAIGVTVVVPTLGRPSLATLLQALRAGGPGDLRSEVLVVDDRPGRPERLHVPAGVTVLRGPARGPAAARNVGWRAARYEWIAFLDDDVVPTLDWWHRLAADLRDADDEVGGVQGRLRVPLPDSRPPTDWERVTAGLAGADWITADMAYRRAALAGVGGFDERFPRAFREDAELAYRVRRAGWALRRGGRVVTHPVRPEGPWVSLRMQQGNADDALLRRLYGPRWRANLGVPAGRRRRHAAVAAVAIAAVAAGLAAAQTGRRGWAVTAGVAAAAWMAGTAEFAGSRIAPGPGGRHEVATMLATSAVIPPLAVAQWLRGWWRWRSAGPPVAGPAPERTAAGGPPDAVTRPVRPPSERGTGPTASLFDAVLFDRDGTLIADVPYNGDPGRVVPMPGARVAVDRLRAAGLRLGVVTNQSGLARGRFTADQLAAVNARVDQLLGPFDTWQVCPHAAGCACRKPAPGLITAAAAALGTTAARCVVVGDIGRDMAAALAAGAAGILVPTPVTLPGEVAAAPATAADLAEAAKLILRRQALVAPAPRPAVAGTVLVVRSDSAGDVLLAGPAIRAVAFGARRVVLLCGPRGRAAAGLLPGVDEIIEWSLPWIDPRPDPVDAADLAALTERLRAAGVDEAVIFSSYHQSVLPLALLLRAAGVGRITAISEDYPGSLLDVRHRVPELLPEPERARSVAAAAGFALPVGDDGALRIEVTDLPSARGGYLIVHPGASVPARACPPEILRRAVAALAAAGHRVLVTAGPEERHLAAFVAGDAGEPTGATSFAELARLLAGAACVVSGNTGPAHLAAAVGTPVVSLFAPTVPYAKWGPYRVPTVRLGAPDAPCRETRATTCPVPGHPCLSTIEPDTIVSAVARISVRPAAHPSGAAA
jgi:HAD superfamily hydrolase (TIGR01662 family)